MSESHSNFSQQIPDFKTSKTVIDIDISVSKATVDWLIQQKNGLTQILDPNLRLNIQRHLERSIEIEKDKI